MLPTPSVASAQSGTCVPLGGTKQECTYRVPITVAPYEVLQNAELAPNPTVTGYITHMETDIVDANGAQVPINRLMLHHIVFVNLGRRDKTCGEITMWDGLGRFPAAERFYAAGEERAW